MISDGIYKLSNGKHIDLDRISGLGEVYAGLGPHEVIGFSIDCQLHDKPLWTGWSDETIWETNAYEEKEIKIKILRDQVQEQHDLLLQAWKKRKLEILKYEK